MKNKMMKISFLGILVLSHVIISVVIGSEEESNDNGKFHEEAEFGMYLLASGKKWYRLYSRSE